jgi:hypothetical protein
MAADSSQMGERPRSTRAWNKISLSPFKGGTEPVFSPPLTKGAGGIGANFEVCWFDMVTLVTDAPCKVPLYESRIEGDFQYLRQKSLLPAFFKG